MTTKRDKTREVVLQATIKLLDEARDCSRLSIRDIADGAGVSTGIPNYYFGSKENLINEAMYRIGERWLKQWVQFSINLEVPPEQKIHLFCRNLGDDYAEHPNVMKIFLNNDLFSEYKDEIRRRFHHEILFPLARAIAPDKCDEEIMAIIFTVSDTFDLTFLRAISRHPDISFDYFHKPGRDKFIDRLVDYSLLLLRH
jgi:AcrR family transcriptional regulator